MILLMSLGTFLGYVIIAIFIFLAVLVGRSWLRDIEEIKEAPSKNDEKFLDKIDELQKKIDSIEKTLKQIDCDKKGTTPSEESQSPE